MKRLLSTLAPRHSRRRLLLLMARDFVRRPSSISGRLCSQNFRNRRLAASLPIECIVCGSRSTMDYDFPDVHLRRAHGIGVLRETLACRSCGASMRDRQMAFGLLKVLSEKGAAPAHDLTALRAAGIGALRVLDTDSFSPLNRVLRGMAGYEHSQYSPSSKNGSKMPDGSINVDLLDMPFAADTLDLVMSSDVMEHISDDDRAHREIFRCLAPGGSYVFTIPYDPSLLAHRRLTQPTTPATANFVLDEQIHGDPHSSSGIEAHRIYGQQLFADLGRIGFSLEFFEIVEARLGIFGGDLFVATKQA